MVDYLYDGTFEGLLTCIYYHYYQDKAFGIFLTSNYQPCMLRQYKEVRTDVEKARKVYEAIKNKISYRDLKRIYMVYLSNDDQKEEKILKYIVMGFKKGAAVSDFHSESTVADVEKIEKKIKTEQERMLQFVRFSVMKGNVLYSRIEPDNDVLELIAHHFSDRFRKEKIIIHDVRRGKAVVAFNGKWYIASFDGAYVSEISKEEKNYRKLWKEYFDNISIKERKNKRCQNRFMPERYRKNLTEMKMV